MGIIRIFVNNVELDFVAETLTVKKENNAFITDFKASHSSYPFLIIENAKTLAALGPKDIASVKKKKVVPVVVLDMSQRFYGELTVRSYLTGYRKCDLKYGSDILQILPKKLGELLPVVSVVPGVTNPPDYTEESDIILPEYTHWKTYPLDFVGKIFPEVNYQFPRMSWKNQFYDDAPEEGDEWYAYKGSLNSYRPQIPEFSTNGYAFDGNVVNVSNANVPSPQLFVLGALQYAFQSIGYTIAGSFVQDPFIRRLLLLNLKNNLCKVNLAPPELTADFNDLNQLTNVGFIYNAFGAQFIPPAAGTYYFKFRVQEPLRPGGITTNNHYSQLLFSFAGTNYNIWVNTNDPENLLFEGTSTLTVTDDQVGQPMVVRYIRLISNDQNPDSFLISFAVEAKIYNMMHPTIELGRYAPDKSLVDYVNDLKNTFGLNITTDDTARVVHFNYASALVTSPAHYLVDKSLEVKEYNSPEYTGYQLKFDNDIDNSVLVTATGATINGVVDDNDDQVLTIQNGFKLVPVSNGTANLNGIDDKDGVGLMIYDPDVLGSDPDTFHVPVIAATYNGYTLRFDHSYGLYNIYWKNTLKFLINGSDLEIEGPFTEFELQQIDKLKKVHIDNQTYLVLSTEFSETRQGNYNSKFQLKSLNL